MSSAFDPQQFLDAQITEANEKRPPLPIENPASSDGLYTAVIGDIKMESGTIGKGDRNGQAWLSAIIPLVIEVPAQLRDSMKLPPTLQLTDRAFLDLTPDEKGLDNSPGKNRRQKVYREATDLNKPGDVFAWRMLQGKVVKVQITHEIYNDAVQERIGNVLKG